MTFTEITESHKKSLVFPSFFDIMSCFCHFLFIYCGIPHLIFSLFSCTHSCVSAAAAAAKEKEEEEWHDVKLGVCYEGARVGQKGGGRGLHLGEEEKVVHGGRKYRRKL